MLQLLNGAVHRQQNHNFVKNKLVQSRLEQWFLTF